EELIQSLMDELRSAVADAKKIIAGMGGGQEAEGGEGEDDGKKGEDKFADFFSGFAPPTDTPDGVRESGAAIAPETTPSAANIAPDGDDLASIRQEEAKALAENLSAADFLSVMGAAAGAGMAAGKPEPPSPPVPPTPAQRPPDARAEKGKTGARSGKSPSDTVIESGESLGLPSGTSAVKKDAVEKKVDDAKVKSIAVDVQHLDDLLEIVGEVSLLGSYLIAKLAGQENLAVHAANLARACGRLHEVASSLRMTSIRPLFMTVRRAAADAARASRKMIDINMRGIDTQVDRSIVENLSAALIHIIRNAVDHGIEPTDERRRAGKPERGSISISAVRTNSDIVIALGDDGKGFDLEAIRAKAVGMGKIAPDASLTDEEAADLVFLPGLSTSKTITGLSGRGVGMEIVRDSINNLRGKVEISTVPGQGSTVRMRFPLMVSALDVMLVRVGKNILVIPVSQVRECFRPSARDMGTIEGRGSIVTIRGIILPVLFLDQEFGIESDASAPEDGVLVVVETGDMLAAVLVDETLGSSQVVIRALEGPLAGSGLVSGAAVLPDGGIGLVIDTSSLTARVSTSAGKAFSDAGKRQADSSRQIDTVSIGSNQVGMIDFSIVSPEADGSGRAHIFAINAFKTREFVTLTELRSIPGSPAGLAGMMMLRDSVIPVIHMGVVLGLMSEEQRRPEWERIVLICEFSGKTVGFLVSKVERVSYISWSDIMPPPSTGGLIQLEYVVGTILMSRLNGTLAHAGPGGEDGGAAKAASPDGASQVAFVLDFERIVGNVIQLYGDMGEELSEVAASRKEEARILLVEDSPLIRKRTRKALTAAGITVMEAGDGQEAWEKMTAMRDEAGKSGQSIFAALDLVLSDIEMPRMDGYTLTYNIKHDPTLRVLPVLLHSSITNDSMIGRATEVEADGFVPKCDPRELADQLKKYL
ncbi:MAG: chemotaxis protein CheW, partial [Planctomycetota bacterium]|nr:chemotaxis protein CheW [Planctomycetota bacterium]